MYKNNNSRFLKNTIFLYIRMAMTLAMSLYVSRIILDKLGILDFGIYTTVNSIVLFVSLFNNALGTGTSRFITVAVGKESHKLI